MSGRSKTSRRAVLAGAAALSVVAVNSPLAAITAPADVSLIALGVRFEKLLFEYFDATFEWAPGMRAAHAEVERKYTADWSGLPDKELREARELLDRLIVQNGSDAAGDRTTLLCDEMEPLAEAIIEGEATTLAGLRAKALVALWEARPISADHEGCLTFSDSDGGASESLFYGVAGLTGLLPLVRSIEARYAADVSS